MRPRTTLLTSHIRGKGQTTKRWSVRWCCLFFSHILCLTIRLLILPLIRSTTELVRGTRPVTLLFHGTQPNNLKVPSNLWNVTDPDGLVLFGALFTSMTATISLLPDFTGYAESRKDAHRAYIIRKAYATATLPLLWQSEAYLAKESDCLTAMADEFVSVGYSEGRTRANGSDLLPLALFFMSLILCLILPCRWVCSNSRGRCLVPSRR